MHHARRLFRLGPIGAATLAVEIPNPRVVRHWDSRRLHTTA
jgi:hypothetical protein